MPMNTLESRLGIEVPIIQAPMAGVQDAALAVAVSNAGGLGSVPAGLLTLGGLEAELAAVRAGTTRPVNLNFFCHEPPRPAPERLESWKRRLEPYYRELDVALEEPAPGPTREPFGEETAAVLARYAPPVVSFHFGLPAPALLDRLRAFHPTIMSTATTVDEARWLEDQGVDVIIAQGIEAGGHRGMFRSENLDTQIGTFALVPQIVAAVRVPVVAAGGIADAAGVAAARALGAAGVQAGTAYLLCPEATTSPIHRALLETEAAHHTAITNVLTGRPARGIVNRVMREVGPMSGAAPAFPLAALAIGPLRAKAESIGRGDFSPLWAGQNVSGCARIPAADLTRRLAAGWTRPA
jgi:nitronate monooxygenase